MSSIRTPPNPGIYTPGSTVTTIPSASRSFDRGQRGRGAQGEDGNGLIGTVTPSAGAEIDDDRLLPADRGFRGFGVGKSGPRPRRADDPERGLLRPPRLHFPLQVRRHLLLGPSPHPPREHLEEGPGGGDRRPP